MKPKQPKQIHIKAKFEDVDPDRVVQHVHDAINQAVAGEVPMHETLRRCALMRVTGQSGKYVADTELVIGPEDRAAFLLGWMACANAVKDALG